MPLHTYLQKYIPSYKGSKYNMGLLKQIQHTYISTQKLLKLDLQDLASIKIQDIKFHHITVCLLLGL